MKLYLLSAVFLLLLNCTVPLISDKAITQEIMQSLRVTLATPDAFRHSDDLQRFYQQRNFQPIWVDASGNWQQRPTDFIAAVNRAAEDGLNPKNYSLPNLVANRPPIENVQQAAAYELSITEAIMDYLAALRYGSVDPQHVFPDYFTFEKEHDLATPLYNILNAVDTHSAILAQTPQVSDYAELREALSRYRSLSLNDNWHPIPQGKVIKRGDADMRIPAIRKRLHSLEWLEIAKVTPNLVHQNVSDKIYSADLELAIRSFQQRHGMKADGVIGSETLQRLNISLEERIIQIALTMERWRWLPQNLGDKYVLVNTAGYYAKAMENHQLRVIMPVIVGQVEHQTPSFNSYITNVKFYPDWTIPSSIAQRYVLDKLRTNPEMAQALGYELYDKNGEKVPLTKQIIEQLQEGDFPPYRLRQKPGIQNALGLARFSVANDYAIYLHDTPKSDLFTEVNRNFSSGCVRVGEPVRLAQFLLTENSPLSMQEVADKFNISELNDVKTKLILLENKIPVYILYMTAWVDEGGAVRFESDAYGRDAKLKAAMEW